MTDYMRGAAQDVDVGLRGLASLNNGLRTMPVESDFSVNPGHVDPAKDVVISPQSDPVAYDEQSGAYNVSGQQVSFETAKLLRYFPGGLQIAGQLVTIPAAPSAGVLDVGIGRVPYEPFDGSSSTFNRDTSEVFLRLDSDGDFSYVVRRDGTDTIIPRDGSGGSWSGAKADRDWSGETKAEEIDDEDGNRSGFYFPYDAFDGTGPNDHNPSGISIDPPVSLLVKLFGTYYGKGPYFLTFDVLGAGGYQRPFPAVSFVTRGDQTITTRAQQPLLCRYDDGGAGNTYTFGVGGRQGSHTGMFSEDPVTPFDLTTGVSVSAATDPAQADLIMAYRRKPQSAGVGQVNFRGTEYGLQTIGTYNDQRVFTFLCLEPDFGGQTPDWSTANAPDGDADRIAVQTATQDTGGSDLTADPTAGRSYGGEIVGSGKNDATVTGLDPAEQPTPRTKRVGLFAMSLTGQSTTDSQFNVVFNQQ
jgi:hypothetical protein